MASQQGGPSGFPRPSQALVLWSRSTLAAEEGTRKEEMQ